MLNKNYVQKLIITLGMALAVYVVIAIAYPFVNYKNQIINYYNDQKRPANKWKNWETIENNSSYISFVHTQFNIINPMFSVVYIGSSDNNINENSNIKGITVDTVEYKRNLVGWAYPVDIRSSTFYEQKRLGDVLGIAKTTDISQLDSTDKFRTYKNPTSEEWIKKMHDEEVVLKKEIKNPSGTDAVQYFEQNNKREGRYILYSTQEPLYSNYKISFFMFAQTKEDFTYWLNDDEFIYLVAKPISQLHDDEDIKYYNDNPDGIYVFNTKTKQSRLYIKSPLSDSQDYTDRYELKDNQIIVYTSSKLYIYSKNGEIINNSK